MLMYSALHILQWFSGYLAVVTPEFFGGIKGEICINPENQTIFFILTFLWIKTNVAYAYRRLEVIARTK